MTSPSRQSSKNPSSASPHSLDVLVVVGPPCSGKTMVLDVMGEFDFLQLGDLSVETLGPTLQALRGQGHRSVAVSLTGDEKTDFSAAALQLAELKDKDARLKVLWLDAPTDVLRGRCLEVGKVEGIGDLDEWVSTEKMRLAPFKSLKDYAIDTATTSRQEIKRKLARVLGVELNEAGTLTLHFMSFAYKRGLPAEADWVIDARFLKNPFYEPALRPMSGLDAPVRDYLLAMPETQVFLEHCTALLREVIPQYVLEGRSRLTIAFGCTGGQHRSVCLAEAMGKALQTAFPEYHGVTTHRERIHWPPTPAPHAGQAQSSSQ